MGTKRAPFFSVQQTFISSLALIGCKLLGKGGRKIHLDNGRFVFVFFSGFRFPGSQKSMDPWNLQPIFSPTSWTTEPPSMKNPTLCPTAMNKRQSCKEIQDMQKNLGKHLLTFLVTVPFILPKKIMGSNEHFINIKYREIWFIYSWDHNTRSTTSSRFDQTLLFCSYKTLQRFNPWSHPGASSVTQSFWPGGGDLVGAQLWSDVYVNCVCTCMYMFQKKSKCIKKSWNISNSGSLPSKKAFSLALVSSREDRPLPSQTQEMAFFSVQKEFQAFIHIASKSCQRDLHIGIQTKGWAPFSTTRNQPEEVCEYLRCESNLTSCKLLPLFAGSSHFICTSGLLCCFF